MIIYFLEKSEGDANNENGLDGDEKSENANNVIIYDEVSDGTSDVVKEQVKIHINYSNGLMGVATVNRQQLIDYLDNTAMDRLDSYFDKETGSVDVINIPTTFGEFEDEIAKTSFKSEKLVENMDFTKLYRWAMMRYYWLLKRLM